MKEEIDAYIDYLFHFSGRAFPKMPEMDTKAYTENEYKSAISAILCDFNQIDDEWLTLKHLKGE